jgi:hypothetical protein
MAAMLAGEGGHSSGSSSGRKSRYAWLTGSGLLKSWKLRFKSTFSWVARRIWEKP